MMTTVFMMMIMIMTTIDGSNSDLTIYYGIMIAITFRITSITRMTIKNRLFVFRKSYIKFAA